MGAVTTDEFVQFFSHLSQSADPQATFAELMAKLPTNQNEINQILNPAPPAVSPVTLLGTRLAKGEIGMNHIDMLDSLIKMGGDPNIHDSDGLCIIHHAAMSEHANALDYFRYLAKLPAVIKDMDTQAPYPTLQKAIHLLADAAHESEGTMASQGKLDLILLMIESGYESSFFEPPKFVQAGNLMGQLNSMDPAAMVLDYVTQTLRSGQQIDLVIDLNNKTYLVDGKSPLHFIRDNAYKNAILEIFIVDVLLPKDPRGANPEHLKVMRKLELLLQNPHSTRAQLQQLVNEIPESIRSVTPHTHRVMELFEKREHFIAKCDKTVSEHDKFKMIGHCLGLRGKFEVGDKNVITYEYFNVSKTLPRIAEQAKKFRQERRGTRDEDTLIGIAADGFAEAAKSRQTGNYDNQAERYLKGLPVDIPCIFEGHYASAVLHKDKLYFSNKDSDSTEFPGIECYQIDLNFEAVVKNQKILNELKINMDEKITAIQADTSLSKVEKGSLVDKINREYFTQRNLVYVPNQDTIAVFIKTASTKVRYDDGTDNTAYNNLGLPEIQALNPRLLYRKKLHGQKQANCSYTNNKRAFEAMMLAVSDDPDNQGKYDDVDTRKIYQEFSHFDRLETVKDHLEFCRKNPNDPRLLDPLLNFLRFKTSFNNPSKLEIAQLILIGLRGMGLNDMQIAQKMNEFKYSSHKAITDFINVATDLKEGTQIRERKGFYVKRALNTILPGKNKREMIAALRMAGMSNDAIAILANPKNKDAEARPTTTTRKGQDPEPTPLGTGRRRMKGK